MTILLDTINTLLIGAAFLNLLLGSIIYFNGPRKKANVIYSMVCASVLAWVFGMILFRSAPPETSLLWATVLYATATFIPSIFLYFTYVFPSEERVKFWKSGLIIFSLNAIVVLMIIMPGFIIQEVHARPGLEKEILFTQNYWFYFLYILSLFTYGFYRLFRKYQESRGIEKNQILYLLLGTSLSASGAFATNLVMPWIGYFFVNWLGQILTVIMVGFASYAIVRYRLMDIRIVARYVVVHIGMAVFVYATFYALVWLYITHFGGLFTYSALALGVVIAPAFVMAFYWMDKAVRSFANKHLFVSLYNYQETINHLTNELANHIDLDTIVNLIVETIKKTMRLDRAGVLLVNTEATPARYQIAKVIGFDESNGISLVQDNFLTKHLSTTKRPLVSEELILLSRGAKTAEDKENFARLHEHMDRIQASLCLPLISNQKLIGVIVLGSKIAGDAYTQEDLELLNTLSKQAGITIENARQHKQIQEFGRILEAKVDEQTKDLQKTNKELEMKDRLNQELLEMKSDFLRVVNHQLNTPISIMRGHFLMMKEGYYKQEEALPVIESGLNRINQIVADFWDAYALEGERAKMNPGRVDITTVVNTLIEEKKNLPQARERGLTLSAETPPFEVPHVWCDLKKITHALSNLLDNAVFYTHRGGVVVSYELANEYLKVHVKDTGRGISEDDKKKMFQKFSRGANASGMRPDGSGLGLYIAKKIIEGNGGEISFTSDETGGGTTFSFTVPMYTNQNVTDANEVATRENKIEIFN